MIPESPVMLLSYINTELRDNYESLEELCRSLDIDERELVGKMDSIGYQYDIKQNQFK
ncbi:MAG: DUF4250 domain-containing protein [Marinilabiliaceae bacterium]|nr:DUF4250 domain-containing protein [Marinilabiliaceae bacterium]